MKLIDTVNAGIVTVQNKLQAKMRSEKGGIAGYGVAWLFGVPVSLLVLIYVLHHH
jgi:hypothetical protein